MDNLQLQIAEAIDMRSKAIHTDLKTAELWRIHLMKLWMALPDHTPAPAEIINHDGIAYILQSTKGSTYRYIIGEKWDRELVEHAPADRRTKILTELHMTNAALYEIAELKAKGEDPVDEMGETEIA